MTMNLTVIYKFNNKIFTEERKTYQNKKKKITKSFKTVRKSINEFCNYLFETARGHSGEE